MYKSGALYLANGNGTVIPDVAAELEKRAQEIKALQTVVSEMQQKLKLLEARSVSGNAAQAAQITSKIYP